MAKHYHAMGILDITKRVGDPTAVKSIEQVAAENDALRHANAALLEALKALQAILCDPHDGEPCFDGSDGDRAVARTAFAAIAAAEGTA